MNEQKNKNINDLLQKDRKPVYGKVEQISKGIRRVMAPNPSPYTLHGTGTYIIGEGKVAIIDPGPNNQVHINALLKAITGEKLTHIFVTHTHADHSPASLPIKKVTGALIIGYGPHYKKNKYDENFEEANDLKFIPDIFITDGQLINGENWNIEAIHTPGHTSNHMCYSYLEKESIFTGDHVMGWSTTVIIPPDGDMGSYMRSLKKLLDRDEKFYIPTHGPIINNPKKFASIRDEQGYWKTSS